MIKELNSLKKRSDDFEKSRGEKDVLAIAVINVGYFLDHVTYLPHVEISKKAGWKAVAPSTDKSFYDHFYALTTLGEPVGLPEYCAHIAAADHTHVMCIFDCDMTKYARIKEENIAAESEFHEIALSERPGQARLSLAYRVDTANLHSYLRDMRQKDN